VWDGTDLGRPAPREISRATFVVAAVLVVVALAVARASRAPASVPSPAGEMS